MENRPLRVPATDDPRFLNRDASFGFAVGNIATSNQSGWGGLAGPVIGFVAGGLLGKEQMQNDKVNGRVVPPPTYLNKDAVIGVSDGLIFGGLFSLVSASVAWPIGLAVGLGALYSMTGHARMSADYRAAQEYVAKYGEYQPAQQQHKTVQATLTPEEAMMLEERLAREGKRKSHVEHVASQPTTPLHRG